ncbi:zinc-binding dehydrogenase [Mycobacterium europaeum]|uniref:quinone oxidoreductase family protein n=1 Tax=Mycobacterium europaeum TaxID=761804 RepID=UPI002AE04CF1|nr:zinc-binding dehydrogenase [Mycobacterium europaeum]MEA1161559.1 SDR family NAD(P)-dependent oxidoreductase [Mycobacterium europaeum]
MKAWLWDGQQGMDHLRLSESPDPVPQEGEVVMEIHYAALNPADRMLAERRYPYPVDPTLPHVLGRDGVGTIVQVGNGVTDVHVGDQRVILRGDVGVYRWGTFAERVSMSARTLVEVPAGWTEEESSGATLVYLSAYHALSMWEPLKPNSVVLVTGASGGVGLAAVQLAVAMGHTVVALSRSEEKQRRLREFGAAFTFSPEDPLWSSAAQEALGFRGVNLAVDTIGGMLLPQVIETMGELGRISLVGELGGSVPDFYTGTLFSRRLRIGAMAVGYYTPEENHAAWRDLTAILARSGARPQVDRVFPFDQLPRAFDRLAEGPMGKVVLRVKP